MFGKKDISKRKVQVDNTKIERSEDELAVTVGTAALTVSSMIFKALITVFIILAISGFLVLFSVLAFFLSLSDTTVSDLNHMKFSLSSTVYIEGTEGVPKEYMTFYSSENREWVSFNDIPQIMIDAQIAIEDHRYWDHEGVDWYATIGSAFYLATGAMDGGGSTITQQLVKNVTQKNEVSLIRKLEEIFTALNLEEEYTKEEILEFYLNIVAYGSGTNGVQAAANLYFGKDIADCSIAECAAIAGITQNPYANTPIYFPERTKARQEDVLYAMHLYEKITTEEYEQALLEAENMQYTFSEMTTGSVSENVSTTITSNTIWNWFTETMVEDLVEDLTEYYNISPELAYQRLYNGGLEIYTTMNEDIQVQMESIFVNQTATLTGDPRLQASFYLVDYDGSTIAVVGNNDPKVENLGLNYATSVPRAAGSSIKPLSAYAPALESGLINYSTVLKDQPLPNYFGTGLPGPKNYEKNYFNYVTVDHAVRISRNAPVAQLLNTIGLSNSYNFMVDRLGFTTLDASGDVNFASLATGGNYHGVVAEEMAAAYAVFGNGGKYYEPYTYTHVIDENGDTIIDNRIEDPTIAMTEVNANIMNMLLHEPITGGSTATGRQVQISGLDIYGKTGTTDNYFDLWFVGGTPYGVSAVWVGYDPDRSEIDNSLAAKNMWKQANLHMWNNYWSTGEQKAFSYSANMVSRTFCKSSGLLAGAHCSSKDTGYYDANNLPRICNSGSDHTLYGAAVTKPTPTPSVTPESVVTPSQPPVTVTPTQPPATVTPTQPPATVAPTQPPATVTPTQPPATVTPTQPPAESNPSVDFEPNIPSE